ncbi:MAG: 2Fe-2S iron-sulfur cluster-binding protein [Eubacterium sp.]|nr:2Fe-2S iron-sulfur cluster-binding protein [Eubacterium sp.]
MINLTINSIPVTVEEGTTILEAAKQAGVYIPTLCYDEAVKVYGACGLCVVEAEGIPKLLRSCSAKCTEGMVVNTESDRVVRSRKIAMELLMSAHDGDCVAPCQLNCPARTDCQGYVGLIANGEYDEALKLIKNKIPLPASIGRVCPHPCEKACRRQNVEESINIAQLKAFVADMDLRSDSYVPETAPKTGKKVSVIGGGPAGLTAA